MSEFTKGKWEYKQGDGNYWTIQSVKAEQVGDCINEANARLIAAAPEMYKLLNYIAGVYANVLTLSDAEKIDNLLDHIDGWGYKS